MQGKTRRTLMILVGAYLIYNGVKLIMDVMQGNPNYKTVLIIFGVIFIVFGAATVILNIRELLKDMKAEKEASGDAVNGDDDESVDEITVEAEGTGNPARTDNTERVWKALTVADEKNESANSGDGKDSDDGEVMMDEDAELLDEDPDFSEMDEEGWGTASGEETDEEAEEEP